MRWPVAKLVFGCSSVLLSYPEDGFADDLAAVADVLGRLPKGHVRARMEEARVWLAGMSTMRTGRAPALARSVHWAGAFQD